MVSRNEEFTSDLGHLHEIREFDGKPHQLVGWHMTRDPNFQHDPNHNPSNYLGAPVKKGGLFYTIDPEEWGPKRYRTTHAAEVWKPVRAGSKVGDENPVPRPDWRGPDEDWDRYTEAGEETPDTLDLDEYDTHGNGETYLNSHQVRIGAVVPAEPARRPAAKKAVAKKVLKKKVGE